MAACVWMRSRLIKQFFKSWTSYYELVASSLQSSQSIENFVLDYARIIQPEIESACEWLKTETSSRQHGISKL